MTLAGIESLPGEGLELRFLLRLRVQNPGDEDLHYDGVWIEVELRGQPLASGGAPVKGVVPRFGEAMVTLPVTASGLGVARQIVSLLRSAREGNDAGMLTYVLRGRLGAPVRAAAASSRTARSMCAVIDLDQATGIAHYPVSPCAPCCVLVFIPR